MGVSSATCLIGRRRRRVREKIGGPGVVERIEKAHVEGPRLAKLVGIDPVRGPLVPKAPADDRPGEIEKPVSWSCMWALGWLSPVPVCLFLVLGILRC